MSFEFTRKRTAKIGIALGAFLILFVALVPVLSPFDADTQEPTRKLLAPNVTNLLGTDQFGRDVLTRIGVGGRRSLGAAFLVVGLTLALSIIFGTVAVFAGGIVDANAMKFSPRTEIAAKGHEIRARLEYRGRHGRGRSTPVLIRHHNIPARETIVSLTGLR